MGEGGPQCRVLGVYRSDDAVRLVGMVPLSKPATALLTKGTLLVGRERVDRLHGDLRSTSTADRFCGRAHEKMVNEMHVVARTHTVSRWYFKQM